MKNVFWVAFFLLSLYTGLVLRRINYASIPEIYITFDEHTNVWHGLSLRKTGIPTAWSQLEAYGANAKKNGAGGPLDGFNLSVNNKKPTLANYATFPKPVVGVVEFDYGKGILQTPIVQPYLDHPPFGALILSLSVSNNTKTLTDINDADLRRMAIVLGIITQTLIFLLIISLTGKPLIGIIASMVYATVPSYMLLSRYALLENVLSPLVICCLILLILAKNRLDSKNTNRMFSALLLLAGVVGGLGALTKLTGWIFILTFAILLHLWKFKFKQILIYTIPSVIIGLLYFAWGFYLAPKLFTDLLILNANRDFIGSINLLVTFFRVSMFNFPVDGWWIGGFIALLLLPKKKEYLPLGLTVIASLFSALGISGANYPWYFIPLIPYMCVAVAIFFYNLATEPMFVSILFTFFTFVSSSLYWGYGVFQNRQPFMLYRIFFTIFIGLASFWALGNKSEKYKRLWFFGVMLVLLILAVLNYKSVIYIVEHWGKLPLIYTPGTFPS